MKKIGHFYHDETSQPPNERGPIAMYSELAYWYLMKQSYF